MIYGIGIDIVNIERLGRALERWGERFRTRVFTGEELLFCDKKAKPLPHLAARLAAKEAFLKAMGMGIFQGIGLRDIEVTNDPTGRPHLFVYGEAERLCNMRGISRIFVSLAHEVDYAIAAVLLEV